MIGQIPRETTPITIKPDIVNHRAEQFSWVPLPYCSPPGCSFPIKISCFVSRCVSSDNSFPSVRQEPSFGPWKGSPFLQQLQCSCLENPKDGRTLWAAVYGVTQSRTRLKRLSLGVSINTNLSKTWTECLPKSLTLPISLSESMR